MQFTKTFFPLDASVLLDIIIIILDQRLLRRKKIIRYGDWKKMLRGSKQRVQFEVETGRRKGVRLVLEEISMREDLMQEERRKCVFRVARRDISKGHQSVKVES